MFLEFLLIGLLSIAAVLASALVAALFTFLGIAIKHEAVELYKEWAQSRRDTKLFDQIKEFRNDFSDAR